MPRFFAAVVALGKIALPCEWVGWWMASNDAVSSVESFWLVSQFIAPSREDDERSKWEQRSEWVGGWLRTMQCRPWWWREDKTGAKKGRELVGWFIGSCCCLYESEQVGWQVGWWMASNDAGVSSVESFWLVTQFIAHERGRNGSKEVSVLVDGFEGSRASRI